uniref:Uncharacterized protein n=1 Tax=Aotus nancymaae TaxID=37293 RepID=A0A2K5CWG1_AOTNA
TGPRNLSPDPLSESENEKEENIQKDPTVPILTPLESLACQVNTPVHILCEMGLRFSHCSHCVPKLEPVPECPLLASCGFPPFPNPLAGPSRPSRDRATVNGAPQFATKQLSRTLSRATPIPEYLKQIPNSCVSGCCCGWLTKTVKETTRTDPINATYSYTDFQKAVHKLLTASL